RGPNPPHSTPRSPTRLPRPRLPPLHSTPPVSPPLHLQPETHMSSSTPLNHAPDQQTQAVFMGAQWGIGGEKQRWQ
ncbi:MAG: hypothetical protein KA314_29980, partial [Chloroflexi bacterium]|nr:hypothetical protein [Chloroflexota bacterium]